MAGYKTPDFNERLAAARVAKQDALDKLRDKPPLDPALVAERQAARVARDAAASERRDARQRAIAEAKAARLAAKTPDPEVIEVQAPAPARPPLNAAELKAARDARYAARKARKE